MVAAMHKLWLRLQRYPASSSISRHYLRRFLTFARIKRESALAWFSLLTDCRSNHSFDPVHRDMDKMFASARGSRFRSEPLIVLLLLSMFALSLHVQLAKFDNFHTFAGTHILHGDLRPDGDAAGQIFADVPRVATAALAAILFRLIAALPSLISGSVLPSSEPSAREFLNYLALFVRPPPLLS